MRTLLTLAALGIGLTLIGAGKPIPPCIHAEADTSGWRSERFNERLSFRLPSTFKRDQTARFIEGGRRWTDGDRELALVQGYWGETSFGKRESTTEGYTECVDTLAGAEFLLITTYGRYKQRYHATAVDVAGYHRRGERLRQMGLILAGSSHKRSDQRLFLAIFRTLRVDSTTAWSK